MAALIETWWPASPTFLQTGITNAGRSVLVGDEPSMGRRGPGG